MVEKVAVELLSEGGEKCGLLRNGQFGGRKRQSALYTVAIIVNRAHAACTNGHITGILLMGNKAAFASVARGRLVNTMMVRQMIGDLEHWTEGCLWETMVQVGIEAIPRKDIRWTLVSCSAHLCLLPSLGSILH